MASDDAYENEWKGANTGLNPMFGDWQHRFKFAPVPYGDGGAKLADFRKAIRGALTNNFFYTSEVRLEITLYLDIQTVLETSETADLDNYTKSILDGLKGPDGILFDDTQVQTLIISYLNSYGRDSPYFDVALSAAPDDFAVKPVSFYEMPDRLWYPHGVRMWTDGGIDEQPDDLHYLGLLILEAMSSVKANTRHLLRQMGWIVSARIKELCLFRRRLVDFTGAGSIQASRCSIARVGALSSKLGEAVTNTKRKLKKPKRYSQM